MTQTRQLFGTDGIRGVAGEFPLTRDSVYWIGRALGHDLVRVNAKARVVIGQDTRVSSRWIADRFLQGLSSVGVETRSAGVITTPGVAFLARSQKFDAGVVISASHNPWTDNGIKIFSGDGYKLPDAHELAIEKEIFTLLQGDAPAALHPETLARFMAESAAKNKEHFDIGVTFDGDADRALFCDAEGRVINGDAVL